MNKRWLTVIGMVVIAVALVWAAVGTATFGRLGSAAAQAGLATPQATASPAVIAPANGNLGLLSAYEHTLEDVYSAVSPSVVNIRMLQKSNGADNTIQGFPFQGMPGNGTQQYNEGLGSGFVWDTQGHIVTNNHVVDGADQLEVTFADGETVPAKVVGTDPFSDLAVLKVDVPAGQLHPIQVADSTQVKVGQLAIAIGDPFGLQGTMTVGIVSAMGRNLPVGQNSLLGASFSIPDVIQTDAPINPGNSGGVLVDDQGRLIGVTAAIRSPVDASAGIGFAIPAAMVQQVAPALIQNGKYEHAYLGLSGATLTPALADAMKLDSGQRGALVEQVVKGGPADKAGLRGSEQEITIEGQTALVGGDVITAIDGQPVHGMDDVIAYLSEHTKAGQKVALTVLRDGTEMQVDVTLSVRPSQAG